MKNVDRLAKYITKNGPNGVMIHTIPKTNNWIVATKIEVNKWILTLLNPLGNVTFNLGEVTDQQHLELWAELIKIGIENKVSQAKLAKELKDKINQFLKRYEETFKKFIKVEKTDKKTTEKRPKLRRKSERP